MRKIIILILSVVCCHPVTAQTYTLEQLKDSALYHNIQIRSALHDIEAARQQRKEAFTNYFPDISGIGFWFNTNHGMAKANITPSEVIPPAFAQLLPAEGAAMLANPIQLSMMKNGTIAGISAVQPVFAGGQIIYGNKLARVGEDVSRLQLHRSENEVEKMVEQYFWQLVSLKEKVKTIEAVEEMLADIHKDVSVAVDAGVVMRNDLLQVQLRQNETESTRLELMANIRFLQRILAQCCGLQNASFELAYQTEELPSIAIRQDHEQALPHTVEYQLLDKQVEVAGIQGGSHAIKRKNIEYRKAVNQMADHSEMLKIKMQKAWDDVNTSYRQLEIAHRSIEQAQENLRLNRDYYKAGISKMSDLLEAQLLYQQACDKRADTYADYQNKLLEYRLSVGQ